MDIKKIKLDDQNIFRLLSSGNTVGLFQLESAGMRDALVNMKPNKFEDIIALLAMRPNLRKSFKLAVPTSKDANTRGTTIIFKSRIKAIPTG